MVIDDRKWDVFPSPANGAFAIAPGRKSNDGTFCCCRNNQFEGFDGLTELLFGELR